MKILAPALSLLFLISCSGFKLDTSANCLNEASGCFKFDKTAPTLVSSVPAPAQIVSVLTEIDLTFSEELNNPQPADFILNSPGNGLRIGSVQKIAAFTYRLVLDQTSVQNGAIALNYANVKDYNNNKANGTLLFTGNVDIGITFVTELADNPLYRKGVSNGGGYTTTQIQFYHDYGTDNNNAWQIRVSTGAVDCTAGTQFFSGTGLLSGVANKVSQTLDRLTHFAPGAGSYRVIVCIENAAMNKRGTGSLLIVRDDTPPSVNHSPLSDEYNSQKTITFTCSDQKDKIIYRSTEQSAWTGDALPADPADPDFDADGVPLAGSTLVEDSAVVVTPNPVNPTRSKFKYRCIDIAGNKSAIQMANYVVDTTLPEVNISLASGYRQFVTTASGGYQTTQINFTTNQIAGLGYRIVKGATSCAAEDGTSIIGGTQVTLAQGQLHQHTINASEFTVGSNDIRICVRNAANTKWGTASLQITRDDTVPTVSPSVASGTYGTVQQVQLTCAGNYDKVAYTYTTANGLAVPAEPDEPTFDAITGNILLGTLHSGPFATPDISTTKLRYKCLSKSGLQSVATTESYIVDSILPTVNIISNTNDFVSNNTGAFNFTDLTFQVSRAGLNYDIKEGSTNCTGGNVLATGSTPAANQNITVRLNTPIAGPPNHFTSAQTYNIKICVANYIGTLGYSVTSKQIVRDDTPPSAVSGLVITSTGSGSYTLNWTAATDANGISGYRIFRAATSNGYGAHNYTSTTNSVNISGLNDADTYFFAVKAVDSAGNLSATFSNEVRSRVNLSVRINGFGASAAPFTVRSGSEILSFASDATQSFAQVFVAGAQYNIEITSQPDGQHCAFADSQFGTISSPLTLNVFCYTGSILSKRLQDVKPASLNFFHLRGSTAPLVSVNLQHPNELTYFNGSIYFGDYNNGTGVCPAGYCIYKASAANPDTMSVLVSGLGAAVRGITNDGQRLFYVTRGTNVFSVPLTGGIPLVVSTGFTEAMRIGLYGSHLYVADAGQGLRRINLSTGQNSLALSLPLITDFEIINDQVYYLNTGKHAIFRTPLAGGTSEVIAGMADETGYQDGPVARFDGPDNIFYDGKNNIFVTDYNNNRVRRFNLRNLLTTTVAGNGQNGFISGVGAGSSLQTPVGITSDGRRLLVTLHNVHKIVSISDSGHVGYWPLSESSLADYTSVGLSPNNASWVAGTSSFATGRFADLKGAAYFNAAEKITALTPLTSASACNVSMAAWFKADTPATGAAQAIVYNGDSGDSGFGFFLSGQGHIMTLFGGATNINTNYPLPANTWVHVAATCINSNLWRMYINGKLMAQNESGSPAPSGIAPTILQIGKASSVLSSEHFKGSIADVRLYNRALTESEIAELAQDAQDTQAGSSYDKSALMLLAHYPFEMNGPAPSLIDRGALGYGLNSYGMPSYATGKDGDASGVYALSGTQYFLTASGSALPALAHPRTICAWVNPEVYPDDLQSIVSYGEIAAPEGRCTHLAMEYAASNHNLVFGSCGSTNNEYARVNQKIPLRSWTHICGSLGPNHNVKIHVNGKAIHNTTGVTQNWITLSSAGQLRIGAFDAVGAYAFNGKIDDVRVYGYALSDDQIRLLSANVPLGLVARYDFTGNTKDTSGFGNDAVNSGALPVADRYASSDAAYEFKSADGHQMTAAHSAALTHREDTVSGQTIAVWIKPIDLPTSGNIYTIVSKMSTVPPKGYALELWNDAGTQRIYLWNGISGVVRSASTNRYSVPVGTYSHLAVSQKGSIIRFYVNGALLTTQPGGTITGLPEMSTSSLLIGERNDLNRRFNGSIDDVRIYNRELSQNEIRALAQQPNKSISLSSGYTGDLRAGQTFGVDGADTSCQNEIDTYFKAMIVDALGKRRACSTANCATADVIGIGLHQHVDWVLKPNTTYLRSDGLTPIFTTNWEGIWDFTGGNITPIDTVAGIEAWTGLTPDWQTSVNTCGSWANTGVTGDFGIPTATTSSAIAKPPAASCATPRRLYCVEQ